LHIKIRASEGDFGVQGLPRNLKIASAYLFQFVWSQRRRGRRVAAATDGRSSRDSIISWSEGEIGCTEQVKP
jgi:hypothetical protein